MDVLSPCALGSILNKQSIPRIKTKIIAGGANNQLESDQDGRRLFERGILYAPDYVINGGGIINVAAEYYGDADDDQVGAATMTTLMMTVVMHVHLSLLCHLSFVCLCHYITFNF